MVCCGGWPAGCLHLTLSSLSLVFTGRGIMNMTNYPESVARGYRSQRSGWTEPSPSLTVFSADTQKHAKMYAYTQEINPAARERI